MALTDLFKGEKTKSKQAGYFSFSQQTKEMAWLVAAEEVFNKLLNK